MLKKTAFINILRYDDSIFHIHFYPGLVVFCRPTMKCRKLKRHSNADRLNEKATRNFKEA
jgi:hypothetical protein